MRNAECGMKTLSVNPVQIGESMKFRKERLDRGIKARCEDIFALSSYREILYLMFPRVLPVLILLILPLLKGVIGLYWEKVLMNHLYNRIACLELGFDGFGGIDIFRSSPFLRRRGLYNRLFKLYL